MARRRKPTPPQEPTGLPPPFPACPSRPPRYGIYIIGEKRTNYVSFCELYAAHKFLKQFTQPFDWHKGNMVFEEYILSCEDLMDIYNYQPTSEEAEWQLPDNYRLELWVPRRAEKTPLRLIPNLPVINLQDLTNDARTARQTLRKGGLIKPGAGWAWPKDHPDLEKVKKLLRLA